MITRTFAHKKLQWQCGKDLGRAALLNCAVQIAIRDNSCLPKKKSSAFKSFIGRCSVRSTFFADNASIPAISGSITALTVKFHIVGGRGGSRPIPTMRMHRSKLRNHLA